MFWHDKCVIVYKEDLMKIQYNYNTKLKQTQKFHMNLYDSLEVLKYSSSELLENILNEIQNNPLFDIEFFPYAETKDDALFSYAQKEPSLKENLFYQLHTSKVNYDESLCTYIIESLDEHGFFHEDVQVVSQIFQKTIEEVSSNLTFIQSFEPCGVAAKNSIDALILQAEKLQNVLVVTILKEYQEELLHKNFSVIAKKLHLKKADVEAAYMQIQALEPFPCTGYDTKDNGTVIPDVRIEIEDDQILITPIELLKVNLDSFYLDKIQDNPILKTYFDKSKNLIMNLDKRNATILLIANEILQHQQNFFLYQDELLPLKQSDVANKLGINQTTVSRAIMNKYYEFQNQVYPFSKLFVSETQHGDSSDAIQKAILEIIKLEDKTKPLSDLKIVEELKNYEFIVSRRTVTKYREICKIGNTRNRKVK